MKGLEAALRRVAAHPAAERLVLRGGLLTRSWVGAHRREADDLDLLGIDPADRADVHGILAEALARDAGDCAVFEVDTLETAATWENTSSPGVRASITARIDGAPRAVQIDVGFGDPMDPPPDWIALPAAGGPIRVLAVRPEIMLAWKLHGLFEHPDGRWRPKDLWDLRLLIRHAPLVPDLLPRALRVAFESRDTPVVVTTRLLDGDLGHSRSARVAWRGYRRAHPEVAPDHLAVAAEVADALRPHLVALFPPPRPAPPDDDGPFPTIEHLDEVLPAVAGRPEFSLTRRGPLTTLTYERDLKDTFPDPSGAPDAATARLWALRRECRGLTFDARGRLVARKLHRFFHLDSRPEAALAEVERWPGLRVLEKLDGSLLVPVPVDGAVLWTTRRGPSDIAEDAARFADAAGITAAVRPWLEGGWTPVFEWCSPTHRLVLAHPAPRLVLLALRHTRCGHYMPLAELHARAAEAGVEAVRDLGPAPDPLHALVAQIQAAQGVEGVVLRAADGRMVKLKSDAFRRLHQVVEHPELERPLWQALLHGQRDELEPALPEATRRQVAAYADRVEEALEEQAIWLEGIINEHRSLLKDLPRADGLRILATEHLGDLDPDLQALVFQAWPDHDPRAVVWASAARMARTARGLRRLKAGLGVPDWVLR
ncbi:MAG: nucleotidyl transferase AbiEii/AbiGii toxin family protein [Alphaproteobacteria bacterium]|nr:nucleotidyl transferase AbiEii/AbiGii toxin family protein [Alphaproteobacteria bacterium]